MTKWAKRNSFFNFFTPPKLDSSHGVRRKISGGSLNHKASASANSNNNRAPMTSITDMRKQLLLEAHFQIGLYLKETFVPKAFLFFVNSAALVDKKSGKRRYSTQV